MRKRITIIFILVIAAILIIAALTRPSDKQIKIEVVDAIWGKLVPDRNKHPGRYEQFMDVVTQDIDVEDWIFFKKISDTIKDSTFVVGYAAFGKVLYTK